MPDTVKGLSKVQENRCDILPGEDNVATVSGLKRRHSVQQNFFARRRIVVPNKASRRSFFEEVFQTVPDCKAVCRRVLIGGIYKKLACRIVSTLAYRSVMSMLFDGSLQRYL